MWERLQQQTRERNARRLARLVEEHREWRWKEEQGEERWQRKSAERKARYQTLSRPRRVVWWVIGSLQLALWVLGPPILGAGLILAGLTLHRMAGENAATRPWSTWLGYSLLAIGILLSLLVALILGLIAWLYTKRKELDSTDARLDEWPFVHRDEAATSRGRDGSATTQPQPGVGAVKAAEPAIRTAGYEGPVVRQAPSPPLAVLASIVLFAGLWLADLRFAWHLSAGSTDVVYAALLTLAIAAALVAVWQGRTGAVTGMSYLGIGLGLVTIGGTVALSCVAITYRHALGPFEPRQFLPAFAAGSALFTAGWLLRRPAVREWLAQRRPRDDR